MPDRPAPVGRRVVVEVEIPDVAEDMDSGEKLKREVVLMQRLSDALYGEARKLRDCDRATTASAVEWGAFHLINEAHALRPHVDRELGQGRRGRGGPRR